MTTVDLAFNSFGIEEGPFVLVFICLSPYVNPLMDNKRKLSFDILTREGIYFSRIFLLSNQISELEGKIQLKVWLFKSGMWSFKLKRGY